MCSYDHAWEASQARWGLSQVGKNVPYMNASSQLTEMDNFCRFWPTLNIEQRIVGKYKRYTLKVVIQRKVCSITKEEIWRRHVFHATEEEFYRWDKTSHMNTERMHSGQPGSYKQALNTSEKANLLPPIISVYILLIKLYDSDVAWYTQAICCPWSLLKVAAVQLEYLAQALTITYSFSNRSSPANSLDPGSSISSLSSSSSMASPSYSQR